MAVAQDSLRVGIFPTTGPVGDTGDAAAYLARVHDAGIDHVCCGDHVSFFVGVGLDGLLQATALAMLHPTLPVHVGVYLLPLRHPVLVARQLADFAGFALIVEVALRLPPPLGSGANTAHPQLKTAL